jgi:hypothetical protein
MTQPSTFAQHPFDKSGSLEIHSVSFLAGWLTTSKRDKHIDEMTTPKRDANSGRKRGNQRRKMCSMSAPTFSKLGLFEAYESPSLMKLDLDLRRGLHSP